MQTPPLAPSPAAPSEYMIAGQPGTLPDLAIINRGAGRVAASVQLYSGASGFQTRALDQQLPIGSLPTSQWTIAVGSVESTSPDILVATRAARTRTGYMEVHVLRGAARYRAFGEQAPIAVRARVGPFMRLLITHAHGFAALYGVYAGRTVVLLSLSPPRNYNAQSHTVRTR
jgi:hypothetical protein